MNPATPSPYRSLGNIAAVEPYYQVSLRCDKCMVEWIGCWDQAACPECGDHEDWDRLMEDRGYYKRQRQGFNETNFGCVNKPADVAIAEREKGK